MAKARNEAETPKEEEPRKASGEIVKITPKNPEYGLEVLPSGGYALKAREITNADGEIYKSGVRIGNGQQVIIKTGLMVEIPPSVKASLIGDPQSLVNYEFIVWNQAFLIDGELCLAAYCHGQYIYIRKGDQVATLFFEKRNLAQVEIRPPLSAAKTL